MTDEDEALVETLGEIVEELRRIGWDDDADGVERAARRIRELSAEKDEIQRKLTSMCMDELVRLGQEMEMKDGK